MNTMTRSSNTCPLTRTPSDLRVPHPVIRVALSSPVLNPTSQRIAVQYLSLSIHSPSRKTDLKDVCRDAYLYSWIYAYLVRHEDAYMQGADDVSQGRVNNDINRERQPTRSQQQQQQQQEAARGSNPRNAYNLRLRPVSQLRTFSQSLTMNPL